MKKAALVTVHGMGRTKSSYAKEFRIEIARHLGRSFNHLHFGSVYYQNILQPNEDRFWNSVKSDLGWRGFREFVVFGFADATGLETNKDQPGSAYTKAQKAIARTLVKAHHAVGDDGELVIVAHSLGGQVISSYLWDAQKRRARNGIWKRPQEIHKQLSLSTPLSRGQLHFLRGGRLRAFYTVGCNIPIFVAAHKKVLPIKKPADAFEWHNFYDSEDVLGWPLAKLYTQRPDFLLADHQINVGGSLMDKLKRSWNPLSHNQYLVSSAVLDPLVALLRSLLP